MKKKIMSVLAVFFSVYGIIYVSRKYICDVGTVLENEKNFYQSYYYLIREWFFYKQNGRNISEYFIKNGIKTIAIYGMGTLGEMLYNDIKGVEEIEILYIVDKNIDNRYHEIPVIKAEDIPHQKKVDVMIVTPIYDIIKITEEIRKYDAKLSVLSLDTIVI